MRCTRSTGTTAVGLAFFLGMGAACAANPIGEIIELQGMVLVNSANSFVPARVGTQLSENDRVFVLEAGSAIISMRQGCKYQMSENETVKLTSENLCAEPEPAADMEMIERAAVGQLDERQAALGASMQTGGSAGLAGAAAVAGVAGVGVIAGLADGTGSDDRDDRAPLSP